MKILVLDDEYLALEGVLGAVREVAPGAELRGFRSAEEAVAAGREFLPDVAFLDIEVRQGDGISVARELQRGSPRVNIIFVTGFKRYMEDAFGLHASGYVMKPVTPEKIRAELEHLRFPVAAGPRMRARTFGMFSASADGEPLAFAYTKTLELLAVLVDANGSLCSTEKLLYLLWEDRDSGASKSYLRNLIVDLRRTLEKHGCGDVLVRTRGYLGIRRDLVGCDYFDFLDRKPGAADAFTGEYMGQYGWAEETLGMLAERARLMQPAAT